MRSGRPCQQLPGSGVLTSSPPQVRRAHLSVCSITPPWTPGVGHALGAEPRRPWAQLAVPSSLPPRAFSTYSWPLGLALSAHTNTLVIWKDVGPFHVAGNSRMSPENLILTTLDGNLLCSVNRGLRTRFPLFFRDHQGEQWTQCATALVGQEVCPELLQSLLPHGLSALSILDPAYCCFLPRRSLFLTPLLTGFLSIPFFIRMD